MNNFQLFLPLFVLISFSNIHAFAEENFMVDFEGKSYDISYDAKGIIINDVTPDPEFTELIFDVQVDTLLASITITIPRELLDATLDDGDDEFFVIADGDVTFSEKKSTDSSRTLFIQISDDTTQLEILGTQLGGMTFESTPDEEVESTVEEPVEEQPATEEEPSELPVEEEPSDLPIEEESAELPVEEEPSELPVEEESAEEKPIESQNEASQNLFNFTPIQNWSVKINQRQMEEFAMVAGAFVAFVIVLAALKGSRTAKSLP